MSQILPKRFWQQYQLYSKNHFDFKTGTVRGRELLLVSAGGTELPVELHFGDFEAVDGDVLVVCFRDVSAQRALNQRYQHVQRRFDMLMTASRDGLWDWDLKTNEVVFSTSWLDMMGIPASDVKPQSGFAVFEDCVFPDDRARVKRELEVFLRSKETLFRTEHRLCRRDGSVRDVVSRACAQRDKAGRVLRMLGIHSNVTSFKEAEREVLRLNQDLEDRVHLRTAQLESALLSAEAANKAKAAFLSVMGHEIRTPMNGVIGMTDLLAKTALDREQKMMVNTVRQSSQSLMTTLDHILDYAVLESGSVVASPERFQLVEFVEGIADSVSQQITKNKQRFILQIGPKLPATVIADANYLRKVLLNLLDNAIKFSVYAAPQGIVQLHLGLALDQTRLAPGRQRLKISVIDNGIGIASEQASHLFEPFVQVENSRARRFGGTGLGLAISSRIVKLMGGRLTLTSAPDEDTCFTLELECEVPEVQAITSTSAKATVLACISDEFLRDAAANILQVNGYKLMWCESAAELSAQIELLDIPVIVLTEADNQLLIDYCVTQNLNVVKLSRRPRAAVIRDVGFVYTDPLLPSALLRAVEREQRLIISHL